MPKRESPPQNTSPKQRERTRIVAPPSPEFGVKGNEPWRKLIVRPDITAMELDTEIDPERAIGERIKFCRKWLENLSVEALSRYTKRFDQDGISRTTLVRYESGDFLPGARELRILTDALWVPISWLLFGTWENIGEDPAGKELLAALDAYVDQRSGGLPHGIRDQLRRSESEQFELEVAKRQRWLFDARKPGKSAA